LAGYPATHALVIAAAAAMAERPAISIDDNLRVAMSAGIVTLLLT